MVTPVSIVLSLGRLLRSQGHDEEAERIYRDALRDFGNATESNFSAVSTLLQELLGLLSSIQKLEQAKECSQAAIENFRTALGPLHTTTLSLVLQTGIFLRQHDQLVDARHLYEHSIELSEKNLTSNNPSIFYIIHDLAIVYYAESKLPNAEAIYQMALSGLLRIHGPMHYCSQRAVINLGACYRDQSKLRDAARMFCWAASSTEKTLGIANSLTIATFSQLTAIHIQIRNLAAAEIFCRSTLTGLAALYGHGHETTLLTRLDLAVLYRDQLKLQDSRTILSDLVTKLRSLEHDSEAIALNCLGTINLMEGRFEEAEESFILAFKKFRAQEGDTTMLISSTIFNLGVLYEAQDKVEKAEDSYRKALQGFQNTAGQRHISTLTGAESLGSLYLRQDRVADAKLIFSETLCSCRDEFQAGHIDEIRNDVRLALNFQRMTVAHMYAYDGFLYSGDPEQSLDGSSFPFAQ